MRVPCEKFVRAKLLRMDSFMESQPMHIEVPDEAQTLVDHGLVEVVPEGEASQATTGAEAEAPAPEAPALPADTAMADGEGHGTAEAAWLEQISKHLHHIEGRLMEAEFLGHEVVRQFGNLLEVVVPPPQGDWGYFPRRAQDIAVRTLRQLIAKYGHRGEPLGEFEVRAMHIVRLYMEEAVHRHLLSARGANVRAGICGFMLTMRNFEQDTLPQDVGTMGLFCSMTESNLRDLAMRLARRENTSVEHMPSYAAAMRNTDMKHEVFSLITMRTWPGSVAMTTTEIRAMSAANGRPLRSSEAMVPGRPAGTSLFGGIFGA